MILIAIVVGNDYHSIRNERIVNRNFRDTRHAGCPESRLDAMPVNALLSQGKIVFRARCGARNARKVEARPREGEAITLKDLAKEAGVSIKTVSRAIHDHPDINPTTKARVMQIVQNHSYSPNWAAQSLRSRRTQTIGFVVPNITNSFFGQVGMTIDGFFRRIGYSTLICFTANDHQNEIESLQSLLSKNIDGIIFAPVGYANDYFDVLPPLKNKPLVFIDNKCEGIDAHYVLHDNLRGTEILVDHLVGHGHRRIACVTGPVNETSGSERLQGYKDALQRHGIPFEESLVRITDWEEIAGGLAATQSLFADPRNRPSAVFYANSQLLLGGYKAFHSLRLSVPRDVATVSFDPPYVIDALSPIPTTLGRFEEKIGTTAAKMLHTLMSDPQASVRKEARIRSTLHVAASCGCA
jgi:LacI family transcriptional regulator